MNFLILVFDACIQMVLKLFGETFAESEARNSSSSCMCNFYCMCGTCFVIKATFRILVKVLFNINLRLYLCILVVDEPQLMNHSGWTTVDELQWMNHSGWTTVDEPQWMNHSGWTTVDAPQWMNHSGLTTVDSVSHQSGARVMTLRINSKYMSL